jgi:hypothetical protein
MDSPSHFLSVRQSEHLMLSMTKIINKLAILHSTPAHGKRITTTLKSRRIFYSLEKWVSCLILALFLFMYWHSHPISLSPRRTNQLKRSFFKCSQLTQVVSIDSTLAITFGVVGTLLTIYGLFIAYQQLKMMHFASRRSEYPVCFCFTSNATHRF